MSRTEILPGFDVLKNDNVDVDISRVDGTMIVFKLKGLIDTYNTPFVDRKVKMAIESGYINLVFDMSDISYMSSTGLGILTALLRMLKPMGGDLILSGVPPKVFEIFRLIGFEAFFTFTDDVEKAVEIIKPQKAETKKADVIKPKTGKFPKIFRCSCKKRLKASKPGKFRCPQCRTMIAVSAEGRLSRA